MKMSGRKSKTNGKGNGKGNGNGGEKTNLLHRIRLGLRPKLIAIFLIENIIPIVLLAVIALNQIAALGHSLRDIAVQDSAQSLNKNATETIERITTDTASAAAKFLYGRDDDIRFLAALGKPADDGLI